MYDFGTDSNTYFFIIYVYHVAAFHEAACWFFGRSNGLGVLFSSIY